jgi:hypothetical protein
MLVFRAFVAYPACAGTLQSVLTMTRQKNAGRDHGKTAKHARHLKLRDRIVLGTRSKIIKKLNSTNSALSV